MRCWEEWDRYEALEYGLKFRGEHARRISVVISEDLVIYRICKSDYVVDFRAVCVRNDGSLRRSSEFHEVSTVNERVWIFWEDELG